MFTLLKKVANLNLRQVEAVAVGVLGKFKPEVMTIAQRLTYIETMWLAEAEEAQRLCYPVIVTALMNGRPVEVRLRTINNVTSSHRVTGTQDKGSETIYFDRWQILTIRRADAKAVTKEQKPTIEAPKVN